MNYRPVRRHRADDSVLSWEPKRRFIGTTAALIGIAAASAATSVATAKIQSNAAHDAASMQQQGSQQAMQFAQQMWGQQQQALNPFIQNGQRSSNLLNSLLTPPGAPGAYNPQRPGAYQAPPMLPPGPIPPAATGLPPSFQGSFPMGGQPNPPSPFAYAGPMVPRYPSY